MTAKTAIANIEARGASQTRVAALARQADALESRGKNHDSIRVQLQAYSEYSRLLKLEEAYNAH